MFALFYVLGSKLVKNKIDCSRILFGYEKRVIDFVNFIVENVEDNSVISCSCY